MGLAAQWLLRDETIGTDRAGVDLVGDQVVQLEHILVTDRHLAIERLAGLAIMERDLTRGVEAGIVKHLDDVRFAGAIKHGRCNRHTGAELVADLQDLALA